MNNIFITPVKIAYFQFIPVLDDLPFTPIYLSLPITSNPPEGFGMRQEGRSNFHFDHFIPAQNQNMFNLYSANIPNWEELNRLFDALKSERYTVLYTVDNDHRKVDSFNEFKDMVISCDKEKSEKINYGI